METNYYLHMDVCGRGKRPKKILHIGKSSGGWVFGLHVIPERGLVNWDRWRVALHKCGNVIKDEYGNKIKFKEMVSIIRDRSFQNRSCSNRILVVEVVSRDKQFSCWTSRSSSEKTRFHGPFGWRDI